MTLSTPAMVNQTTTGPQSENSVAALADGGWVVTWTRQQEFTADKNIFQQRYEADGQVYGTNDAPTSSNHALTISEDRGTAGAETLKGTNGGDIIDGKGGNDRLIGRDSADTFVLGKNYDRDTITDFVATGKDHDIIDLTKMKSITDFADLKANHMSTHGHDVWIDGGKGDVLVLKGVDIHDLDKGDFIFRGKTIGANRRPTTGATLYFAG